MMTSAEKVALQVIQQAIAALATWAEFDHPWSNSDEFPEVTRAKEILDWKSAKVGTLSLLFDRINLSDDTNKKELPTHYHPLIAIDNDNTGYPKIPYPLKCEPSQEDQQTFKAEINNQLTTYLNNNSENLSLLMLILEKFGSCLSFGEPDVALVDMARTTAALATSLINNPTERISLIAGDLSGIQKFIYTISSDGALKSLRARSFYLELVTEEVVQQLLAKLDIPRTNIIYAGGGNLYILGSETEKNKIVVQQVRQQFNQWLLQEFQGKVFLALDCLNFPITEIATHKFVDNWSNVTKNLAIHKSRKFVDQISDFIAPHHSHEPCRVCHSDNLEPEKLKPLNKKEPDSVLACENCRKMFNLGRDLFGVQAIVRSTCENIGSELPILPFNLPEIGESPSVDIYYHFFKTWNPKIPDPEMVFLVNNWILEHYQLNDFKNVSPLLLGNYGKQSEEKIDNAEEIKGFMSADEMAKKSKGIKRVGYLQMDVDRLGQIFAEGLGEENQTLPRLAGLSRQMSYFFKVYLNSLAENKNVNIPKNIKYLWPKNEQYNILFIYAGGDDLFISGAWNEVVDFSFNVYQCFRAYTGNNPYITLSSGISIDDPKFPLYQAAQSSKYAEGAAKGNGKNSLGLFGEVFKWDEWLGIEDLAKIDIDSDIREYLHSEAKPSLFGILPFVEILEQEDIGVNYSRSFVRNLLITAQIQEQALDKLKENKKPEEALAIRYYLHLPKIAYTLARLPKEVLQNDNFRTSLKNPYNAPYFRAIATWIELLNREPLL